MDVDDEQLENWRIPHGGEVTVPYDSYVSGLPQPHVALMYVTRMSVNVSCNYWSEHVRKESCCRRMFGF